MPHRVLIVEDDAECASDLAEIMASIDCSASITDNAAEAEKLIDNQQFCLISIDLAIKQAPDSLKGNPAHGLRVLDFVRRKYGRRLGAPWTPVVVVSGNANEPDDVISMMRDSQVDDIIRKPLKISDAKARMLTALEKAGRGSHDLCHANVAAAPESGVAIVIGGKRDGKSIVALVCGSPVSLPESSLHLLLQLALASAKGVFAHRSKLGKVDQTKRASRLRDDLKHVLGARGNIVINDREGGYRLRDDVRVSIELEGVKALEKAEITKLAMELVAASKPQKV